jgi:DNA-binding NtrC family response regulator
LSGPTTHKNSDRMVRAFTPPHNTLPVVCVVTTDDELRQEMCLQLMPWFQVVVRHTLRNLAHWTREAKVVAVLMDVGTAGPEMAAKLAILKELRVLNPHFVLVTLSSAPVRALASQAKEAGADAHFRTPVDSSMFRLALVETLHAKREAEAREQMQRQAMEASRFQDLIGSSEPMRAVYDAIQQVADSNVNVLIRGESGTGKELVARALVALSRRAGKPYIRLNCAALPENLIESELFGTEKGAYTGANESRPGQLELAHQGTLFLDEIATLTLPLQTKLLRVLEDRQVQRLGGRAPRKIDFRLICATNEPLEEMVRTGRFREDLYYRIFVVPIQLPPLRQRPGDITLLCEYFMQIHCGANGIPTKRFTPDALQVLEEHEWPGNVRELENLIQRLVFVVRDQEVAANHLPTSLLVHSTAVQEKILLPEEGADFDQEIERFEIALLTAALSRTGGSKAAAARLLHLDGQRIKYLCRKHAI